MNNETQPEAEAMFVDVRRMTVADAQAALIAFTNITWHDLDGHRIVPPESDTVVEQQPVDDIGKMEPTNLAIVLTVGAQVDP